MKNNKIRICELNTQEKSLTFRKFYSLEDCRFFDEKDKKIDCAILDPVSFFKNTTPEVGSVFKVMITRCKNRTIGKRIITAIIKIDEPEQMDIEHFINYMTDLEKLQAAEKIVNRSIIKGDDIEEGGDD